MTTIVASENGVFWKRGPSILESLVIQETSQSMKKIKENLTNFLEMPPRQNRAKTSCDADLLASSGRTSDEVDSQIQF